MSFRLLPILIAVLIGLITAGISYTYQNHFDMVGGDINFPYCTVQMIMQHHDPYTQCPPVAGSAQTLDQKLQHFPTNPVTAAIPFLPVIWLPVDVVAALFIGISSALLAFGMTKDGAYWRLAVFLSVPYWRTLQLVQWPILLLAVTYLPSLLFLCLCKPNIGLVVALPNLTWRRVLACGLFGMISLALLPDWPWRWLVQTSATYDGFIPMLTLPFGPPLALAALAWRKKEARTFLLMACIPQNAVYDQLLLWCLPQTLRQMLFLVAWSWIGFFGMLVLPGVRGHPIVIVTCTYLSALGLVLWQVRGHKVLPPKLTRSV